LLSSLIISFNYGGQKLVPRLAMSQTFCLFMAIFLSFTLCVPGVSYAAGFKYADLRVVGNHVLTPSGKEYMPEGISVYGGLEDANYTENIANDNSQIEAAAKYWHANTIRLQVAESNLLTRDTKNKDYNSNFLNELIKEVDLAHSLGEVVVINDQTEFTTRIPNPTAETVKFWQIVGNEFKHQPDVIFDLFNEPRLTSSNSYTRTTIPQTILDFVKTRRIEKANNNGTRLSPSRVWSVWRNGGSVGGTKYIGMQNLVKDIRSRGVNNIIWIEGPYEATKLPEGSNLVKGSNIEYAYHHVNLNAPSTWNSIGRLSTTHAVVDGEWAQYQSPWAECYSDAYKNAPLYLKYLSQHNVGIVAWSLQAGSLLKGSPDIEPTNTNVRRDPKRPAALRTPDRLSPSYVCSNSFGQGVGKLLLGYFEKNSQRYSPFSKN
jgi:hypothetical protein